MIHPSQLDSVWLRKPKNQDLKNFKLLYVGRVRVEKGIFSLVNLIKNNKGDQDLVFNIFGNGDGLKVNLNSTKYKVKINELLLKSLKEKKLDFRLN